MQLSVIRVNVQPTKHALKRSTSTQFVIVITLVMVWCAGLNAAIECATFTICWREVFLEFAVRRLYEQSTSCLEHTVTNEWRFCKRYSVNCHHRILMRIYGGFESICMHLYHFFSVF